MECFRKYLIGIHFLSIHPILETGKDMADPQILSAGKSEYAPIACISQCIRKQPRSKVLSPNVNLDFFDSLEVILIFSAINKTETNYISYNSYGEMHNLPCSYNLVANNLVSPSVFRNIWQRIVT